MDKEEKLTLKKLRIIKEKHSSDLISLKKELQDLVDKVKSGEIKLTTEEEKQAFECAVELLRKVMSP